MGTEIDIAPELPKRIDAIASRSTLTASEVIGEALLKGHSLGWQEKLLVKVAEGIAAADRGALASSTDIDRVTNKHCPT